MNTKGRDFVFSDPHGAFSLVLDAMKQVNFDPDADRLLVGGDLIDRDAESWRAKKFLELPYVYSVRGNHEDMWLDLYSDDDPAQHPSNEHIQALINLFPKNGFEWWLDTGAELRAQLIQAFRALPIAIEVETARGTIGIVHANVPAGMSWSDFTRRLEAEDQDVIQEALWGRDRIKFKDARGVPGIGRVFVGHSTVWNGIERLGNVYAIDSGASSGKRGVKGGRFSMFDACLGTMPLTEPRPFRLLDIREESSPAAHPFGLYAAKG